SSMNSLTSSGMNYTPRSSGSQTPRRRKSITSMMSSLSSFAGTMKENVVPTSPFNSPENAVILFDWDDTLCPTWWAFNIAETECVEELDVHAQVVEQVLRAARKEARVAIVTLATQEWWRESASLFLPGIDVKALFKELEIRVYYAVKPGGYGEFKDASSFKLRTAAKKKAMAKCLANLYPTFTARSVRWNVLSIGDSAVEQRALQQLLAARSKSPLCKTLKMTSDPTLEDLTSQLLRGCSRESWKGT
ncbi:unnamed protein product, partial [Polarella glacialis]